VQLRIAQAQGRAYLKCADKHGFRSRNAWARAWLNYAVDAGPCPHDVAEPPSELVGDLEKCYLPIQADQSAIDRWFRAARASNLTLPTWATLILDRAAGVSPLADQLQFTWVAPE